MTITLEQAQTIVTAALAHGIEQGFKPLTVAVLDLGGALVALGRQDGSGFLRPDLAVAKASGVLALGMTNRAIAARAADSPEFFTSVATLAGGKILSVPGGVFVRDSDGGLLGAVGVTGDASLNDEAAALAGIAAAALVGQTGAE
ncbi:GlcG/HbpS family heme-binding protein [Actinacidiphila oryziradicis]|uniref:Heme-binding protein n=1 Tax=Actinacidiphila oryziradicis TaxID=2571141 RepID=A0A4U0RT87_9ACTN|nr:heme-binding protein [Actinacidiphila oryziradicis]TJZ99315.1 heme-binding protein [Actinacidiphila oryziradicis]